MRREQLVENGAWRTRSQSRTQISLEFDGALAIRNSTTTTMCHGRATAV